MLVFWIVNILMIFILPFSVFNVATIKLKITCRSHLYLTLYFHCPLCVYPSVCVIYVHV